MKISEKIYEEVKKVPEPLQAEVLDFVEYLTSKVRREGTSEDELSSANLSLSLAMKGTDDEDTSLY
jgi:hypothetical protein